MYGLVILTPGSSVLPIPVSHLCSKEWNQARVYQQCAHGNQRVPLLNNGPMSSPNAGKAIFRFLLRRKQSTFGNFENEPEAMLERKHGET